MLQTYHALPERQPSPPIKHLRSPAPQLLPPPHQCFVAVCVLPRVDVVLYGFIHIKHLQCRFPQILKIVSTISGDEIYDGLDGVAIVGGLEGSELSKPFVSSAYRDSLHRRLDDSTDKDAPLRPNKVSLKEEEHGGESVERVPQNRFLNHCGGNTYVPKLEKLRKSDGLVAVSQFVVELQGLKSVEGEDLPTESSVKRGREQMTTQRCDGLPTEDDEGMLEEPPLRGLCCSGTGMEARSYSDGLKRDFRGGSSSG
ncbi:hypothetical protein Ahy_B05g079623 [Arachis hypogaea]|uniref:Uncharacterized protein n=1 Tax=Arachis hypogaea TaxID=3818 RepID=A0A444ZAD8_ARAHY|nr:hypothetical protein Ahy_B05g079623 [Arachis hypogaea]